jgi:hypothetical protein
MIAYNRTYLENKGLVEKAKYWFAKKLISSEQMALVLDKYNVRFYTPAIFIKIGLFIFTYILIGAAISMYSVIFLLFDKNMDEGFGTFTSFLFAAGSFAALELLIKNKNLFRSGIDEALLYAGLGFLIAALCFLFGDIFDKENTFLFYCILLLPILGAAVVRYTDRLVAMLLAICLYAAYFLLILKLGDIAKMIMPFALMILSAVIYRLTKGPSLISPKGRSLGAQTPSLWEGWGGPYKSCIVVFECVALIVFYLACNYYIIRESSIAFFDMSLAPGEDIPLAFVFYILTAIVPIAYVYFGLKRKDKVLLWIGLVLVAAAALTFKYYFSLGHPEITLTLAGTVMIIIAYVSIKYLKTPKHGITFEEEKDEDSFLKTNAEALIIAQSFSQQGQSQQQSDTNLGGGDFGGAGAGGKF